MKIPVRVVLVLREWMFLDSFGICQIRINRKHNLNFFGRGGGVGVLRVGWGWDEGGSQHALSRRSLKWKIDIIYYDSVTLFGKFHRYINICNTNGYMLYFDYSTDAREKKNSLKWADLVRIHVGWNMMWCTMITHLSILDLIASLGGDKIAPSFNKCNINKLTPSHASCFVFSTSMSFRLLLIILTSIDANYSTPC